MLLLFLLLLTILLLLTNETLLKSFPISKFTSAQVRIKSVTVNNSNQGGWSLTKGQFSSYLTLIMHPIHQMLSLVCKCLYTPS